VPHLSIAGVKAVLLYYLDANNFPAQSFGAELSLHEKIKPHNSCMRFADYTLNLILVPEGS